jgi:YYY domain-containing protein
MTTLLPRPAPTRRRLPLAGSLGQPRSDLFTRAAVVLILFIGLVFRVHGFDWDSGTHQHPDERFMTYVATDTAIPPSLGNYFDTQRSSLNPYERGFSNYAYGQLPLTLTRLLAERTGHVTFETVYRDGRVLSIIADLLTILFTWLLARRIFGTAVAHLAALLVALSVLNIQLSHFFTVDTFATCFATASLYFGQRAWQRDDLVDAGLAGAMAGLAVASKVSAAILLPVLCLAFFWPRRGRPNLGQLLDAAGAFGVAAVGAAIAFRIAEPYAFAGPAVWNMRLNPAWLTDKAYQIQVSSGSVDVPFMIQWAGTSAYVFVIQAIVRWGMGPALGLSALAGLALVTWRLVRGHPLEREAVLVLAWAVVNLVYFGGQFAKFLRYLLPAYPALIILAAYALVLGTAWISRLRRWELDVLHRWLAPAVVSATAVWALAFSGIYDQPHSRIQASQWIYANIPRGATIATEHWDDRLPLGLTGADTRAYQYAELTLYDAETQTKRDQLEATLDKSDYIILASRRLIDSIPRLPERYPLATTYYRLLTGGSLGFQRVAVFQVEPHEGSLAFDDSRAQEDFTVYDHPVVEIWAKESNYSSASLRQLLGAVPLDRVVNVRPIDGGKGALLESPTEEQAQETAGTWRSLFRRNDLANRIPIFIWLLAAESIALSSLPLLWRTLPFLPDRGFGASKILGLAFIAYIAWLVASLRLVPFRWPLLFGVWGILVIASLAAVWPRRSAFLDWLGRERRLLWISEAVFLAGFGLFLFIRAANPDLWHPVFGGEKPMNFAYLNAVTKSEYFPPYDPWFAGGIINYYYFGFVLIAVLIKLTGILPEVAFNLAQPTLFGALCAGAFSLAFGLSLPVRGRLRRASAYLAGVAAVLLVGVVGNLDAGLQVLDQLWRLGTQRAPESGGIARLAAGLVAVIQGARFPPLDFWRSTRFIGPEDPGPIHEFPYFTFLYGDLHAHQIALPLTVALLIIAVNLLRALRAEPGRVAWLPLVWAGVLVGMLRATNTWDFPTYGALVGLALGLGAVPGLVRFDRRTIRTLLGSLVVLGVLAAVSFWPYLQRYQLFYTGVDAVHAKTALNQYLTIHGLPIFLAGSLLAWYFVRARRRVEATRRERPLVAEASYYGLFLPIAGLNGYASLAGWVALSGTAISLLLALNGYGTRAAIVFGIAVATSACVGYWRQASRSFHGALLGAALFATLIPEFVALQGDVGRMNTVFKFYLQAWILLGIVGAVALGWLARRASRDPFLRTARPAWLAALALLGLAALAYPLLASQGKVGLRFADLPLGLDGMAFMDRASYQEVNQDLNLPGDAQAIRWLQDNITGTPVVLEGRAPVYHWGSRVSVYTGLPTLLGWDVHESQQRTAYPAMIQDRAQAVEIAYSSTDPGAALAVFREYNVKYVYVGGLERAYYPPAGVAKLAQMPELRLVYDASGVQIYEVAT